jgi:hypothetical protein
VTRCHWWRGYARKYAIRLLQQPIPLASKEIRRPRERRYGQEVQEALAIAWTAAHCICGKWLVPLLEEHGHLTLTDEVRSQLLAISPATADRILSALRPADRTRGATTTRPGPLLKQQVPVGYPLGAFADWNNTQPSFFEGDVVAHGGNRAEGLFLWSLVLTDVRVPSGRGWTGCLALRFRSQDAVIVPWSGCASYYPSVCWGSIRTTAASSSTINLLPEPPSSFIAEPIIHLVAALGRIHSQSAALLDR